MSLTLYDAKLGDRGGEPNPFPGMEPCQGIYEVTLWNKDEDRSKAPPEDRVKRIARGLDPGQIVWLNVEPLTSRLHGVWGPAKSDQAHWELMKILNWMHEAVPGLRVGVYGGLPIGRGNSPSWKDSEIRAANESMLTAPDGSPSGVADAVDLIMPSLYVRWDQGPGEWEARADRILADAEIYQKQVIPFVWPYFHNSHEKSEWRGRPIPHPWWSQMLSWVEETTGQAVLWGHPDDPWEPDWWVVTQPRVRG